MIVSRVGEFVMLVQSMKVAFIPTKEPKKENKHILFDLTSLLKLKNCLRLTKNYKEGSQQLRLHMVKPSEIKRIAINRHNFKKLGEFLA
jgi:hypothetical protein